MIAHLRVRVASRNSGTNEFFGRGFEKCVGVVINEKIGPSTKISKIITKRSQNRVFFKEKISNVNGHMCHEI